MGAHDDRELRRYLAELGFPGIHTAGFTPEQIHFQFEMQSGGQYEELEREVLRQYRRSRARDDKQGGPACGEQLDGSAECSEDAHISIPGGENDEKDENIPEDESVSEGESASENASGDDADMESEVDSEYDAENDTPSLSCATESDEDMHSLRWDSSCSSLAELARLPAETVATYLACPDMKTLRRQEKRAKKHREEASNP